MWPSTGKPGTMRHTSKYFFLHLQSCRRPYIELSKFYRRSLSRSHSNKPNRSLPSAWNNTFLRNRSIFSRYLRTPRYRRSHMGNELVTKADLNGIIWRCNCNNRAGKSLSRIHDSRIILTHPVCHRFVTIVRAR